MSDDTPIRNLLSAVGKLDGKLEGVVASVDRIETRMDGLDDSMTRAITETHAHIDRNSRDMEARIDQRGRESAARIVEAEGRLGKEISEANKIIAENAEASAVTADAIVSATASWRTLLIIGGGICGLAALIAYVVDIARGVHS